MRRKGSQRILCDRQPHTFHREELRILLHHRVLGLSQDRHHFFLGQRVERAHHRQTANEFGNHSESEQVLGLNVPDGLLPQRFLHFKRRAAKAHHFLANAFLHNFIQPDKGAATNEENLLRVDLDVFLVRMFPATLRRNIAGAAFENFQKRLLNAFAGNVARDAYVVGLATDLVDFVDVNDADLGPLHVVIGILQQPQDDILDIFAHIAGFGECGRIGDAKWDIENFGQRLGQ